MSDGLGTPSQDRAGVLDTMVSSEGCCVCTQSTHLVPDVVDAKVEKIALSFATATSVLTAPPSYCCGGCCCCCGDCCCVCAASVSRGVGCFHCRVLSVLFSFSPFLTPSASSAVWVSLDPTTVLSLLGCSSSCSPDSSTVAPSARWVRCQHGSTRRFSTMSCVYSTHHFLRALNSFPSLLQRISLALSSLLALPELLLFSLAPPEPSLLSRSS